MDSEYFCYADTMFLRNFLLIIGATVGAGIFSLPYVVARSGWLTLAVLLGIVGIAMGGVNYYYYMVVLSTKKSHQFPGYVQLILGKKYWLLAIVLLTGSTYGALWAYLTLGGHFFANLFDVSEQIGVVGFYIIVAVPFLFLRGQLEVWDHFFTVAKIALFTLLSTVGIWFLLSGSTSASHVHTADIPLAYGTVLFALAGFSIIPELKKMGSNTNILFVASQVFMVFLYFVFALGFAGKIGPNGEFAFDGIVGRLLDGAGLFSVYTPYLLFSWVGFDMLTKDLKFHSTQARVLIVVTPLLLLLLGASSFAHIVAVTGGIFLGGIGYLILAMYKVCFPGEHTMRVTILQILFVVGIVVEIGKLFF